MKATLKDALSALGILKALPKADLEALQKDSKLADILEHIGKTMHAESAEHPELAKAAANLTPGEMVVDLWQQLGLHAPPKREEIKIGPSQRSSGGGAADMVADYADPTKQSGITLIAESLARLLGPINDSMKANLDATKALGENFGKLVDTLVKKADEEENKEEKDDETEKANAVRAKAFIAKAKRLIEKADDASDEARISKGTEKTELKAAAKAHRKEAGDLLAKALMHAAGAGSLAKSLTATIKDVAAKSEVEVALKADDDEDDKKDDDSEKGKGDAGALGKGDDAGADSMQEKDDQASAKAAVLLTQVESALAGLGMLSTDVRGLMDTIAGKSRSGGHGVPDFAKGGKEGAAGETDLMTKIDELSESGQMPEVDAFASRDIAGMLNAVAKGQIDKTVVLDRIAKSSAAVKMLFAPVTAKLAA